MRVCAWALDHDIENVIKDKDKAREANSLEGQEGVKEEEQRMHAARSYLSVVDSNALEGAPRQAVAKVSFELGHSARALRPDFDHLAYEVAGFFFFVQKPTIQNITR